MRRAGAGVITSKVFVRKRYSCRQAEKQREKHNRRLKLKCGWFDDTSHGVGINMP